MFEQKDIAETVRLVEGDAENGLTSIKASRKLQRDGLNEIKEQKKKSKIQMFLSQLHNPMIYILFAAAGISIWHHELADACIILAVVLLNAIIGMAQESKAEAALEALKKISSPLAIVKRGGKTMQIQAKEVVVGDLVLLRDGDVVPADIRLTKTINLKVEESALTGESVPVEKNANAILGDKSSIGDRINMAFSSTGVAYGRGEGLVVATGMDTEMGKIAKILSETKIEMTPLQKRLAELGKFLGIAAIAICLAMLGLALWQGRELSEMMLTAISLAVAAVPEGLPAVVTIVLALGVQRLVKVNTIVRRLPSVETLGAVSVVCSDKTGTLTQNKMTVVKLYQDGELFDVSKANYSTNELLVRGFVLCNDASDFEGSRTGDPTELALIDMGINLGIRRESLEKMFPRVNELAFDSNRKLMTTVHSASQGRFVAFTKGAMDNLLERSDSIIVKGKTRPITNQDKEDICSAAKKMADSALRVLGLAYKTDDNSATEQGLTFVGLVGMIDPPRPEAKESVRVLREAGVRTVMITGDHKDTAFAIAKELGITDSEEQCITGGELDGWSQGEIESRIDKLRVFARVSPEHKVMIVRALKSKGYIVSMTGDGVNDAPSLKAADIGVAMGITGTEVAKGAADMVLTDDNFATIEKAVNKGRTIYANIKKSVLFLLSSNFGEVITMFAAIAAGIAAPLKAVHILWVNLITDTLPGLALGVDTEDKRIMSQPPRNPKESLFAHGGLITTVGYGFVIACITLAAFLFHAIEAVGFDYAAVKEFLEVPENLRIAQTFAFVTLGTSQLFHALGMRNVRRSVFASGLLKNKVMILALALGLALQLAVTEIPVLCTVFNTERLDACQWAILLLFSIVPLIVHEIAAFVIWLFSRKTKGEA